MGDKWEVGEEWGEWCHGGRLVGERSTLMGDVPLPL